MSILVLTQFMKVVSSFVATHLASRRVYKPINVKCFYYPDKYTINSEVCHHITYMEVSELICSPHILAHVQIVCTRCSSVFHTLGMRLIRF